MAQPRIFVSSTYYDLKHIRASLERFIERLGYEAILSEKGAIAYAPDVPLDESCYREAGNADIFVLIIGGRYGSEKSAERPVLSKEFHEKYDSITKQEYKCAIDKDVPVYILVERAVYADYETYLLNKGNASVKYAHVDSVNIFRLIDEIRSEQRNNPIQQFDRYMDIETWLRAQWAGLFKDFLSRRSEHNQLASLSAQVKALAEVNETLKAYLEEVVTKVATTPEDAKKLIDSESERLERARQLAIVESHLLAKILRLFTNISIDDIHTAVITSNSYEEFLAAVASMSPASKDITEAWQKNEAAEVDYMRLREALGLESPEVAVPKPARPRHRRK